MSEHTPAVERTPPDIGGTQKVYSFENGYGASVVCHRFSYGGDAGLWELAVVEMDTESDDPLSFSLTYDTPITDDVEGRLTPEAVDALLDRIAALPDRAQSTKEQS